MAERTYLELEAECSKLRGQVYELKRLIEFDRTGLAKGLGAVIGLVSSWGWIPSGEWGSYEWDERTETAIREEIGRCFDAIATAAKTSLRESGDRVAKAFGPQNDLNDRVGPRHANAPVPNDFRTF